MNAQKLSPDMKSTLDKLNTAKSQLAFEQAKPERERLPLWEAYLELSIKVYKRELEGFADRMVRDLS